MANRKFLIFHLSLIPVREPTFETPNLTREAWLWRCLSNRIEFDHRADQSIYWVPRNDIGEYIYGVIQREKPHLHHMSPEQGGRETVSDEWQGAYVLLDPTHHDEGQRIAIEIDDVGSPSALLKSLLSHLNNLEKRPFTIEAEPVFDGMEFWKFAERHSNVVRYVNFEFVVPNMWGTESELEKDLKDSGKQTGAEKVRVRFEARDGIAVRNQKIEDGVAYAEKGAGKITARSLDGKPFSSENRPRTTEIPKVEGSDVEIRDYVSEHKDRVLGRDKD